LYCVQTTQTDRLQLSLFNKFIRSPLKPHHYNRRLTGIC